MIQWLSDPAHIATALSVTVALLAVLKLVLPGGPLVGLLKLSPTATADLILFFSFATGFSQGLSEGKSILGAALYGLATLGVPAAVIARTAHASTSADAQASEPPKAGA